jgi:hypothetical protein
LIIGVIAQVLKTRVMTVDLARKYSWIFWGRRLFPVVLILIGVITGIMWQGDPSVGVDTMGKKILYFGGAATVAITAYSSIRTWVKKKYDIDIMVEDITEEDILETNILEESEKK